MRTNSLPPILIAAGLVAFYAYQSLTGWVGGLAYSKGRRLAAYGRYEEALPYLQRAPSGLKASPAHWLAGQVRIGLWQYGLAEGRSPDELEALLSSAFTDYTRAISMSPASGWYWAALGDLYHQRERIRRREMPLSLETLDAGPWGLVGRPGRIAVGLSRAAIEREPNVYLFRDQLALQLWEYGLRDEALEAVRESARVLPVYHFHEYVDMDPTPPEILEAFAAASREALDSTPFLRRNLHHIALARVAFRRGRPQEAEAELRKALALPGQALNRAEAYYLLGRALAEQQRDDEALEAFENSLNHPNFTAAAVVWQATIEERRGRIEEALQLMRRARRLRPRDADYGIRYARLARRLEQWDRAAAALRRVAADHRDDPRPLELLADLHLQLGRKQDAARTIDRLDGLPGTEAAVERLRSRLATLH